MFIKTALSNSRRVSSKVFLKKYKVINIFIIIICSTLYVFLYTFYRYVWNYLVNKYLKGQEVFLNTLEDKHGDVKFENISFGLTYFVPNLVRKLDSIDCKPGSPLSDGKKYAISIQTGSWDLANTPIRNLMLNPRLIPALIDAIRRLKERPCGSNIHLVKYLL